MAYTHNTYDPMVPYLNQKPQYGEEQMASYNVTDLSNGFTVLTESQTFPSAVNMGKCSLSLSKKQGACAWPLAILFN